MLFCAFFCCCLKERNQEFTLVYCRWEQKTGVKVYVNRINIWISKEFRMCHQIPHLNFVQIKTVCTKPKELQMRWIMRSIETSTSNKADVNVKWVSFRSHTERVVVSENTSDDSIQKNRNRNYRHIKSLDENQSNKIWKFSISVSCCRQRQSQQQQQQLRLRRKNRTHIEFGLKVAAFKVRAFKVCVCVRVIHRKSILILGEK